MECRGRGRVQVSRFVRKETHVDAIRVTETNLDDLAVMCGGVVKSNTPGLIIGRKPHIEICSSPYGTIVRMKAYIGDWIIRSGTNFEVYTNSQFEALFDPVTYEKANEFDQVHELVEEAMKTMVEHMANRTELKRTMTASDQITQKILDIFDK